MFKYVILLASAFLLTQSSFAQTPTPSEQACNMKLSSEITSGLQYTAALITTRTELVKAQARIKELEDKYEPKK